MFEKLRPYQCLAWDFDQTLIDHSKSEHFWRFIDLNPFDQIHHIVTMRSHGLQHNIFDDLEIRGSGLHRLHFQEIVNVPDVLYDQYYAAKKTQPLHEDHPYFLFKGMMCKRLGAEVLVDDMEAVGLSQRGCDLHGITHIHPDDL